MTTETKNEVLPAPTGDTATELVKEAFDEARELARLEVALAKKEAIGELEELKRSGIAFGAAVVAALLGLAMLLVALALALGGTVPALVIGAILLVAAAIAAWFGASRLPKKPFGETRRRLEDDVKQLKERIA